MAERTPFPAERVCGERFRGLLNLPGKITKDNPCAGVVGRTIFCNEGDCEVWKIQADYVWSLVSDKWKVLYDTKHWPSIAHIRPDFGAYMRQHNNAPDCSSWMVFGMGGASGAVDYYITEIEAGICILDRIEHELTTNVPDPHDPFVLPDPPTPPAPISPTTLALGALGVLGVGFLALNVRRRK